MYEFAVTPAITQLRRPGVTITEVTPGAVGDEIGLEANDRIVKVNGRAVRDYLDFRFQTAGETELIFQVKKTRGETVEIEFDRDEGEDLGLMFEQIAPRQCANECLFCFTKGNPEGARPSLFIRDEDIRLSFLYGNYTTLSSITPAEMDRIVEQRLSPQYVSVHATDLKTRAILLGVPESRADISDKIRFLLDNDIEIHAQVVLCPKINYGDILEKAIRELGADYPKVISTAIVPMALTRFNTDERLTRVTPEFCRETIKRVEKLQKEFRRTLGKTFAFLGDEIYIKAGVEIPSRRHYGSYPQIEDGVGMMRTFLNKFEGFLDGKRPRRAKEVRAHGAAITPHAGETPVPEHLLSKKKRPHGTLLTGEMFAPILRGEIDRYNRTTRSRLKVVSVPNNYFGGDVAVAGLLSGQDFEALKESIVGDFVIVPKVCVKSDEPVFIDGMPLEDLKSRMPVPLLPMDTDDLLDFLSPHLVK